MKLFLCGGGSGEKTIEVNKKLNEIIDHKKPLLYIPLAMDNNSYDECLEWIKEELSNVDIPSIDMVSNFDELAKKDYNNYCAIYIGGGNTYRLLKGMKESVSFDNIKKFLNNDGIIFGGSAGAIIFGYDINSCLAMDPNDVNLKDTKGFNVINNKSIFAHYTNEYTEEEHIRFKNYLVNYSLNNEEIIALPEEDTIFINNDDITIIGNKPYYIFKNGKEYIKNNIKEYTYNILDKVYYWMLSKQKNIEVRILKEKSEKIQVGDYIVFNNQEHEGEFIKVKVIDKKLFDDVNDLLNTYDINCMMPNHTPNELKDLLFKIYGEELNKKKIVAFTFEFISSDKGDD